MSITSQPCEFCGAKLPPISDHLNIEKPMTPHERARAAIGDDFRNQTYTELIESVTAAIQAATKDIETLFAQQAQRADGAESRTEQATAQLMEATRRALAAIAREAALRRALVDLTSTAETVYHWHDWGKDNEGMVVSSKSVHTLWSATESARAALALSPGEALERVRREAQAEVWEQIAEKSNGYPRAIREDADGRAAELRKKGE